ncbi:hypothetical protein NL676_030889 [Syzygium grande]|nr:hypothetical protein NL676_030889 [Syzygium grande]
MIRTSGSPTTLHMPIIVGEPPYAETFCVPGPSTISNVCGSVKCVVFIISGRAVVIKPYVSKVDALVAAWLPGTEGQGATDLLFGDYDFIGKLARTWFRSVDQLPMNIEDPHYDPLFPFGFGLTTKGTKESNPTYSRKLMYLYNLSSSHQEGD